MLLNLLQGYLTYRFDCIEIHIGQHGVVFCVCLVFVVSKTLRCTLLPKYSGYVFHLNVNVDSVAKVGANSC